MYETFRLVSEIMDPDFHYHLAVSKVWGELARSLADSVMLPFDCRTYVAHLQGSITTLKTTYAAKMLTKGITFGKKGVCSFFFMLYLFYKIIPGIFNIKEFFS